MLLVGLGRQGRAVAPLKTRADRHFIDRGYATVVPDWYGVLGLTAQATHAEVKNAYFSLSKEHHPDKNSGTYVGVLHRAW